MVSLVVVLLLLLLLRSRFSSSRRRESATQRRVSAAVRLAEAEDSHGLTSFSRSGPMYTKFSCFFTARMFGGVCYAQNGSYTFCVLLLVFLSTGHKRATVERPSLM